MSTQGVCGPDRLAPSDASTVPSKPMMSARSLQVHSPAAPVPRQIKEHHMGVLIRLINRIVSALAKRKVRRDEGTSGRR